MLREQFLRETILKALQARPLLADAELDAAVTARLHRGVFPEGAGDDLARVRDELAARGLLMREEGRWRRAGAEDGAWMLSQWFDALGGVVELDDALLRSPLPYAPGHFEAMRAAGVTVVYSFEESAPGEALRAAGFDWRPHFWTDNGRPTAAEMDAFLDDLLALPEGTRALVHCKAGLGRTGMAAACALMARHGWDAERALEHYWARLPLAREIMEEFGQAAFVRAYSTPRRPR